MARLPRYVKVKRYYYDPVGNKVVVDIAVNLCDPLYWYDALKVRIRRWKRGETR